MLTPERIREVLSYCPDTGNLLWRITKSATAPAGSIAGSVNEKGHVNLQIDKTLYAAHQVVFLLHHGYLPEEIDHADQNKQNNRIGTLRPCKSSQNKGNIGLLRSNTSGFKGVSFNKRSGKFHAQIKIHGKQTYLGRFADPRDAALAYNAAAIEHFGTFAWLNDVTHT